MPLHLTHHDVLVIGLPAAGKSTYLAALWELVDSGHIKSVLRLGSVANTDRTYLNRIRDRWLKCEPIEHTTGNEEQLLSIPLLGRESKAFELRVPDLSGETFQRQWIERQWLAEFRSLAENSIGCLLFINPEKVVEPAWLDEAMVAQAELPSEPSEPGEPGEGHVDKQPVTPWNPEKSPTQVVLVDLLQSLLRFKAGRPFKVAVIISAWDLVQGQGLTPAEWVGQQLPLLDQFLWSNRARCTGETFGISAQGGDLKKNKDELQNADSPSDRLICVFKGASNHDISAPIRWLAGME